MCETVCVNEEGWHGEGFADEEEGRSLKRAMAKLGVTDTHNRDKDTK